MLIITDEQMKILSAYMERSFQKRMIEHLRKSYEEKTKGMTDKELNKVVEEGIAKAKGYSVTEEEDIQRYLEYMMKFGKAFDTHPSTSWAGDILRPKHIDGARKMRRIANRIRLMEEGLM